MYIYIYIYIYIYVRVLDSTNIFVCATLFYSILCSK